MATKARAAVLWLGATGCAPTVSSDPSTPVQPTAAATDSAPGPDDDTDSTDTADDPPAETGPCGLSVQVDERFFLEGDTVRFTVACSESAITDAAVTIAGAGAGGRLDARTGLVSWETDGRSGGRYDVTVGTSGGGVLESEVVTIWVADNPEASEARSPIPREYTEEWGLPVVHVDTDATLTESEQEATITVRDQQVTGFAKIRGASSTSYPKVSYTLDFESEELGVTEWGDRTREHMILITAFDDNSYIRQKLGYDLWMAMAEHQDVQRLTPRTFFAILYLNGQYQGIYTACDRVDDEFLRHMGTEGDGSLYKSISHDANFYSYDARGQTKSWLGAGYDKKEGDPDDWSDLAALVTLTGTSDNDTLWANHPGIDMDEFADWMIWAQFTLAQDSAGKNAYLYADPEAGRWRLTPWDLNESWGQNWYTLRLPATYRNDYIWNNRIFALLQEHPEARQLVERRFQDLRDDGPLQVSVLNQMIDEYRDTLGPNIDRDWQRWGSAYQSFDRWRGDRERAADWTTPAEELDYVRTWLEERLAMYDAEGPI
jgi:hypothetical protein